MRSAAQKLLCVMSLGALMVPALSFAATDNPFASVERSADTMTVTTTTTASTTTSPDTLQSNTATTSTDTNSISPSETTVANDGKADLDGDGVGNQSDWCPDTPSGSSVDKYGCSDEQRDLLPDDDGDGIINQEDICPQTTLGQKVDTSGCSDEQRTYLNKDDDGDGLTNGEELTGWELKLFGTTRWIKTNPDKADTDGDEINDAVEKSSGLNPMSSDTDHDTVSDKIDQEITPPDQIRYVDPTTGITDMDVYTNRDDDNDKILDQQEQKYCLGTPEGESVYPDGEYIGCSLNQRKMYIAGGVQADTITNDITAEAKAGNDTRLRYEKLSDFAGRFNDKLFGGAEGSMETGERGVRNLIVTVARDAKNFFTILAFAFLIIVILMSFFGGKGDEDAKRLKGALIYTSLGIMLMQVSFVFINALFNKDVGAGGGATGIDFYKAIILPIINLVRLLASFVFLAMAFFAFFQMVTAGGDPKAREKGITTIISAIVGFVLIKLAEVLVTSVYGKINCPKVVLGQCDGNLLTDPNLSDTLKIFTTIINYANGFIALITLLIILFAGWNIIFNGEEGIKKGKSMIKWIVVGLLLLVTSYILFRFFILKG